MKVNSIQNPYYNYSASSYAKNLAFQKKILITPEKNITKSSLWKGGAALCLGSVLCKLFDIEDFSILNTLADAILVSACLITEKPSKLEPEIVFNKATTIDEAKDYAKNKLGIKNFKIDDLEYANWINEGLTNISNRFKGEVHFPSTIKFTNKKNAYGSYNIFLDTLSINKKNIDKATINFDRMTKNSSYEILTKYNFGPGHDAYCRKLKQGFENKDSLSVFDKYELVGTLHSMRQVYHQLSSEEEAILEEENSEDRFGDVYISKFDVLYHEIGHCFAYKSKSLLNNFIKNRKYKSRIKELKIPDYSKSSPKEFIACTFAGILNGHKYSREIRSIFEELTSFKIPEK